MMHQFITVTILDRCFDLLFNRLERAFVPPPPRFAIGMKFKTWREEFDYLDGSHGVWTYRNVEIEMIDHNIDSLGNPYCQVGYSHDGYVRTISKPGDEADVVVEYSGYDEVSEDRVMFAQ